MEQRSWFDLLMSLSVDKFAHAGLSFFLLVWFAFKPNVSDRRVIKVALWVLALGLFKETIDHFGRHGADVADVLADLIGILLGVIFVVVKREPEYKD